MSVLPEAFQAKPVWKRNLYWKRQGYNEALEETKAPQLHQAICEALDSATAGMNEPMRDAKKFLSNVEDTLKEALLMFEADACSECNALLHGNKAEAHELWEGRCPDCVPEEDE